MEEDEEATQGEAVEGEVADETVVAASETAERWRLPLRHQLRGERDGLGQARLRPDPSRENLLSQYFGGVWKGGGSAEEGRTMTGRGMPVIVLPLP